MSFRRVRSAGRVLIPKPLIPKDPRESRLLSRLQEIQLVYRRPSGRVTNAEELWGGGGGGGRGGRGKRGYLEVSRGSVMTSKWDFVGGEGFSCRS